ncbi:MAG TPA: divergent polysaccharide deacetylase family protein [Alphaproteobacteria bacterium]|nr:divergent polysaccharide deacetylase family protein [Alphaproteobacteria bacterium]
MLAGLVLLIGLLGLLVWLGLTYDPSEGPQTAAVDLPLPARAAGPTEAGPTEAPAPQVPIETANVPAQDTSESPAPIPAPVETAHPPQAPSAPTGQAPAVVAPQIASSPDALPTAPDPALVERSGGGLLPVVGADGRKPWKVYARPFDANNPRPRIAIIISGLGQSAAVTEAAIQTLPGSVTLAFNPYGQRLEYWAARARAAGHEVLVMVPMEPVNYPANDPGPQTLLTTLSAPENRERLNWSLARFPGYVGVLSLAGSNYTTAPESLRPTLDEIRARGLMFVDMRTSLRSSAFRIAGDIGVPRAFNNRVIDIQASKDEIDRKLDDLVKIATTSGFAVGVGQPYPATVERVLAFVRSAEERGLAIAPVSAIADHQKE